MIKYTYMPLNLSKIIPYLCASNARLAKFFILALEKFAYELF